MLPLLPVALALLPSITDPQRGDPAYGRDEDVHAVEIPRVLFLTHSAGFVHDVVKRPAPDQLAPAERLFSQAASGRFDVTCTQDCAALRADGLARYSAVMFLTTGELPVPDDARHELVDWVAHGGAFIGVHCATDTFYKYAPYQQMIGGVFDGHPWHTEIGVNVEDARHPATARLGKAFQISDEIYQFRDFRRFPVRVLLTLDTASIDAALGKRADGDYALAWCRDWGEGRVFYSALGHEEAVWADPRFLDFLLAGVDWAIGGPDQPVPAPAKAEVLCDGKSLGAWKKRDGGEAGWKLVGDGAMEVAAGAGDVVSRAEFGDALIHVEFMTPAMPTATGQARGNSGVYVQGRYEVQVLDSYGLAPTLGDCGAIYGKKVADANASRAPERWQSYDIEFTAPRFDAAKKKSASARMSVWHNGIPIHADVEVDGPTAGGSEGEAPTGPLLLQDHGNPVRYRNVWVLPR